MAARSRTPWKFVFSYAGAERRVVETPKGPQEFIWADGRSARAESELKPRLDLLMIKRPRSIIWADTPPKNRQVIRLDVGGLDESQKLSQKDPSETHLFKALEKTLKLKKDAICENVVEDLCVGEKTVVWVLTRESVEIMATALEKATGKKNVRRILEDNKARLWATHGEAGIKERKNLARDFREHSGSGVIVATMDSMPEAISLMGASSEHFAQLHYLPGPMFQAENRPYHKDIRGLHLLYYIAKGTVDERVERIVLPRVETLERMSEETDAAEVSAAFAQEKRSLKDMWSKMFAKMETDTAADVVGDEGEPE